MRTLLVETGRDNNIEYENRIRILCDLSKVEDEYIITGFVKCR